MSSRAPNGTRAGPVVDRPSGRVQRFTIDGTEYALYPDTIYDDELFWVFGDATNGLESYGGGRFLYSDLPDENGRLILDFNRCYIYRVNPFCSDQHWQFFNQTEEFEEKYFMMS